MYIQSSSVSIGGYICAYRCTVPCFAICSFLRAVSDLSVHDLHRRLKVCETALEFSLSGWLSICSIAGAEEEEQRVTLGPR